MGLEASGRRLLIDPYESGSFHGAVTLPPLADTWQDVVASHGHADHAAVHTVPGAREVEKPGRRGPFSLAWRHAFHDEWGGRLRGGTTRVLRIVVQGRVMVHCGDIGERPGGPLLLWLRQRPIDLLILPAGGWYTLDGAGALEWVAELAPRACALIHTADDGVRLAPMAGREQVLRRWGQRGPVIPWRGWMPLDPDPSGRVTALWVPVLDGLPPT